VKNQPSLFLQQIYSDNSSKSCAGQRHPEGASMHREDGNSMTVWGCPAKRRHWGSWSRPGPVGPRALVPSPTTVLVTERNAASQPARDREPLSEWIRWTVDSGRRDGKPCRSITAWPPVPAATWP